ncbi:phosphopantetheine-binding protein [Nocardiopsis sp. NPDC049922]|uniref:phosphopantetheine-binding protein n=1 Tax=Nocardiopsis sp. NPDC049922 TaxID=3155157 RepID=UPI0033EDEB46
MTTREETAASATLPAAIRAAWRSALGTEFDGDADFFALGGDSLAALSIAAKLEESLGFRVGLRVLFEHPRLDDYIDEVARIAKEAW